MTVRAVIKGGVARVGLLPLFWATRRALQRLLREFLLLPLRLLVGVLGSAYVAVMWRLQPDWKFIKDYLTKLLGSFTTTRRGRGGTFVFYTPNSICQHRADSLFVKEPETLDWIDEFGRGEVLCDIGANVGVYSIYHGITNKSPAYACEPDIFNLPGLVKNINANHLQSLITVVSAPLTSSCGLNDFKLHDSDEGGAHNAFGVDYGPKGKPQPYSMSYRVYGVTLDSLFASGMLHDIPALIKIDVDGIEHLILAGARQTLMHPSCRSVLVEIDEEFAMQAKNVHAILTECGFTFREKKRSPFFDNLVDSQGVVIGCFNHIWVKR